MVGIRVVHYWQIREEIVRAALVASKMTLVYLQYSWTVNLHPVFASFNGSIYSTGGSFRDEGDDRRWYDSKGHCVTVWKSR